MSAAQTCPQLCAAAPAIETPKMLSFFAPLKSAITKSADSPPSSENSSAEAFPANSAPSVQRTSRMASALGNPMA